MFVHAAQLLRKRDFGFANLWGLGYDASQMKVAEPSLIMDAEGIIFVWCAALKNLLIGQALWFSYFLVIVSLLESIANNNP